ncbi:MAG: phosphoglycerate kinase [Candidatus Azambacteria bacterium]|nr:phosphoglycerate kinase [Candidatus Azambacteria bacterium]
MMKSIIGLKEKDLRGKKVLLRVDFNVPVSDGKIQEKFKIKANKETLDFLINKGARVGIVSHITSINSFEKIADQIKAILNRNFAFLPDCIGVAVESNLQNSKPGDVFLLENIRKYEGEEKNDSEFAKKLAEPFDLYVNDAFSESHRNYASVAAITQFLPSYAGFSLMKEIENLKKVLNFQKKEKSLVLGGAKIDIKFSVIKNFLDKAEHILIGGAVANIFLEAKNIDIKKSLSDKGFLSEAKEFLKKNTNIFIPEDYIMSNDMILDIGEKTISQFIAIISKSKIVIWNGPLGKVEDKKFSNSSKKIADAIIKSGAFSVVGGGDTIAFLEKINLIDRFSYVSTGGGAMLTFLAGNELPGLIALESAE